MYFGHYIRECRKEFNLTQDELVEALYGDAPGLFRSLDASALSKWERGVTRTSHRKMASILGYFQKCGGRPLPCIRESSPEKVEERFCKAGLHTLLGRAPKHLVIDLQIDRLETRHFSIIPLRQFERMDELLEIHQNLHENLNPSSSRLQLSRLREWALHPDSLFYVVCYKHTVLGLLFALRLQTDSFEKIMNFSMERRELNTNDFAPANETAGILMLSLFSLDSRVASLLLMRLYAHLIAHQDRISELGVVTALPEVERLVDRLDLRVHRSRRLEGRTHIAYRNSLNAVLRSRGALQLLFPRGKCREKGPSPEHPPGDREDGSSGDTLPD